MAAVYPFSAIVGQDEMKIAILIAAVDPSVGGVAHPWGSRQRKVHRSPRTRIIAAEDTGRAGMRLFCDPVDEAGLCEECRARKAGGPLKTHLVPVPLVDLPLGVTEDRVVGARSGARLTQGIKAFEPGLLARAHRGFLYIDEVNLLEDYLVDLLLDAAASGENLVEREGLSIRHPARFVLVGTGNPEEGELRPQLLDRFGLSVEVRTSDELRYASRWCGGAIPSIAIRQRLPRNGRRKKTVCGGVSSRRAKRRTRRDFRRKRSSKRRGSASAWELTGYGAN